MPYVSVKLSDGIGNRLFQVAAMLGYAEKYSHTPIFVKEWIFNNPHSNTNICDYFQNIPIIDRAEGLWKVLRARADEAFTYIDLPRFEGNVKLEGFFQSERYFPSYRISPPILQQTALLTVSAVFLHVRRGDYLNPDSAHHRVELIEYYRRVLSKIDKSKTIVVCSNDMAWCRDTLPDMYEGIVDRHRWIMRDSASDTETLALMTACDGAICANSTFSWWGAYFGSRNEVYMPDTWGYHPLPPARDIYPAWANVIPVI